ncbi:hypothetical protein L1887_47759 [Cichorium endivia]|nr:hypothetical protein L1887_47759 [Cichorium endivia]
MLGDARGAIDGIDELVDGGWRMRDADAAKEPETKHLADLSGGHVVGARVGGYGRHEVERLAEQLCGGDGQFWMEQVGDGARRVCGCALGGRKAIVPLVGVLGVEVCAAQPQMSQPPLHDGDDVVRRSVAQLLVELVARDAGLGVVVCGGEREEELDHVEHLVVRFGDPKRPEEARGVEAALADVEAAHAHEIPGVVDVEPGAALDSAMMAAAALGWPAAMGRRVATGLEGSEARGAAVPASRSSTSAGGSEGTGGGLRRPKRRKKREVREAVLAELSAEVERLESWLLNTFSSVIS